MFANIGNLYGARSYEQCLNHYERTPWPKTRRQGSQPWDFNQRPLGDKRQRHYRIVKGNDFFDVYLYHTRMARFYAPMPDGSYCVEYTRHDSTTSSQFMWRIVGSAKEMKLTTVSGLAVIVPVSYEAGKTRLWFTANHRLDISRSEHQQVYKLVTSDEMKAWRRELKQHLSVFTEMMEITVPALEIAGFESKYGIWRHPGKPWAGMPFDVANTVRLLQDFVGPDRMLVLNDTSVTHLRSIYEACVSFRLAQKDYQQDTTPLIPANITRSFLRQLDGILGHKSIRTRKAVPLPMFPTSLPRNWMFRP